MIRLLCPRLKSKKFRERPRRRPVYKLGRAAGDRAAGYDKGEPNARGRNAPQIHARFCVDGRSQATGDRQQGRPKRAPEKRSFSQNPQLAAAAGRKGGLSVSNADRSFSRNRRLAAEAGRKGGSQTSGQSSEAHAAAQRHPIRLPLAAMTATPTRVTLRPPANGRAAFAPASTKPASASSMGCGERSTLAAFSCDGHGTSPSTMRRSFSS